MASVITAFMNIVKYHQFKIDTVTDGNNRANNMGQGLETYIKDIFADTFHEKDIQRKLLKYEQVFSYEGNKNNPPDLMLKNGDAIEIKKTESKNSAIALNSSYPKDKLYADSPMITKACKNCEVWKEKDMLYAIGQIRDKNLKSLWLLYGDCFCAGHEIYEKIKTIISGGITTIPDVDFTETKELGKVKRIDPLGITDLRIRGMWHIENPNKIFHYIYTYDDSKTFQLITLMTKEKYQSLPLEERELLEKHNHPNIETEDVKIKNPNNPVQLIDARLMVFKV